MQRDLFSPRHGPAIVYRFPLARRADLIRATVKELASRSYAGGKRYWSDHAQKMGRELKASGLSRSEIDAEITAYSRAIRREMFSSMPERMTK